MSCIAGNRYLITRRITQVGTLLLFWLGANQGLGVLTGNLSSSRLFRSIPLSDPYAVLQILATGHLLAGTVLLGALLILLFYFIVGGRAFCAWVCPVNPISDLAALLKRRHALKGGFRVARYTRYWVMALAIPVSAMSGVAAFEWISPIGIIHRELIYGPGIGLFLVVASLLVLDLFILRDGWCQSLCPLGAFYALVGRRSTIRIGFYPDRCDSCGDCVQICPEQQVIHFPKMAECGFIDAGDCLNCGRCIEGCPTQALTFSTRFTQTSTKDE
jgi:ferredoxin-type protein NapH